MNDDKQPVFATAAEYYAWWLASRSSYPNDQDFFEAGMAHARSLAVSPAHTEAAPAWKSHRMANVPYHGDPSMRVIGFAVPVSERWPLAAISEQLAEIIGTPAPSPVSGEDERAALDEGKIIAAVQKACGEYRTNASYSFEDVWNCIEAAFALAPTPTGQQPDEALCDHEWQPITTPHKECTKCGEVRIDPTRQQALSTKDS